MWTNPKSHSFSLLTFSYAITWRSTWASRYKGFISGSGTDERQAAEVLGATRGIKRHRSRVGNILSAIGKGKFGHDASFKKGLFLQTSYAEFSLKGTCRFTFWQNPRKNYTFSNAVRDVLICIESGHKLWMITKLILSAISSSCFSFFSLSFPRFYSFLFSFLCCCFYLLSSASFPHPQSCCFSFPPFSFFQT